MQIFLLKPAKLARILLQVNNVYLKFWYTKPIYDCGKIRFDDTHYVIYIHLWRIEFSYEQFRKI
jgi:hypothetical protein